MSGGRMRVLVDIAMPRPGLGQHAPEKLSIEDRVRDALELIESGYKSDVEWIMINKLYKALCSRDRTNPRVQNLIQMIEPVLSKYGYHGVSNK